MNRRRMLQALLAAPVVGALGGCRREDNESRPSPSGRGGTLKVILQGPFAVVIDTKNHFRIKAFVPFDSDGLHEFCFRKPHEPKPVESDQGAPDNRNRFQFTLLEDNLEISDRPGHIDSGFAHFTLHTGPWEPRPKDYFVVVDLPAPELITYIPPSTPVLFAGSKLDMMPTNHVLEYKVRDFSQIDKVRLRSSQLGDTAPLSCSDLLDQYEHPEREMARAHEESPPSTQFATEFRGCDKEHVRAFVLGVGLPAYSPRYPGFAPVHAREFFNRQLLTAFPNSPDRDRLKLEAVDVTACPTSRSGWTSPTLIPAVESYEIPQPRLVPVSAADECRAGGLNAINP